MKKLLICALVSVVVLGVATVCLAQTPDGAPLVGKVFSPSKAGDATMPVEARYVAAGTDVGVVRDHNEDSFGVFRDAGVYLVADGMGGHAAGEVASAMAVDSIGSSVNSPFYRYLRLFWPTMAMNWLRDAYDHSHEAIHARSRANFAERGMGTTAVSVLTTPEGVWIVNLGDSRAYRIRGEMLVQISHDHSLVQQLIDEGQLTTPEEIARFPYKNIITRVMGTDGDHENDAFFDVPHIGDIYVLCSDGLTNEVEEPQMMEIIRRHGTNLQAAVDELIATARKNGGRDNITVILIMM